mmetsp:Transcript_711/g.1859  ORF Transcript_711/g.1859 Transcript_711/m.1859 type:complete len:128 (+) Transcript_711:245-628(+)
MLQEMGDSLAALCARALALKRLVKIHRPHATLSPVVAALAANQEGALHAPLEAEERARQLQDLRELMPDIPIGHSEVGMPTELIVGHAARARIVAEAEAAAAARVAASLLRDSFSPKDAPNMTPQAW